MVSAVAVSWLGYGGFDGFRLTMHPRTDTATSESFSGGGGGVLCSRMRCHSVECGQRVLSGIFENVPAMGKKIWDVGGVDFGDSGWVAARCPLWELR